MNPLSVVVVVAVVGPQASILPVCKYKKAFVRCDVAANCPYVSRVSLKAR